MIVKGAEIQVFIKTFLFFYFFYKFLQKKVLEIVEFVLRELNFVPYKELTALNTHLKQLMQSGDYLSLRCFLCFLFQILPINISVKDAFRELSILETFLNIVQTSCTGKIFLNKFKSFIKILLK